MGLATTVRDGCGQCRACMESGTEGRTRTGKAVRPVDFESTAFTNFATPAGGWKYNQHLLAGK